MRLIFVVACTALFSMLQAPALLAAEIELLELYLVANTLFKRLNIPLTH